MTEKQVTMQVMEKDDPTQTPITITIQKTGAKTPELMKMATEVLKTMELSATPLMVTVMPTSNQRQTQSRGIANSLTS